MINATIIKAKKENYIYCIKNDITIGNKTLPCPTYPFALSYQTAFSITDGSKYIPVPAEIKRHSGLLVSEPDVHPVHFEQVEEILDENEALKEIEKLRIKNEELKQESTLINLPQGNNLSYKHTIIILTILLSIQTLAIVGYIIHSRHHSNKQTNKILRTVTDPMFAERIYEKIQLKESSPSEELAGGMSRT